MRLFDKIQEDYREAILNLNEFGEEVTYVSKAYEKFLMDTEESYIQDVDENYIVVDYTEETSKTIKALPFRSTITPNEQNANRTIVREMEILILCDEEYGIPSVKKGEDIISVPVQIGQDPVDFVVGAIIEKDEAIYRLRLMR